jgi:hypothetical protein
MLIEIVESALAIARSTPPGKPVPGDEVFRNDQNRKSSVWWFRSSPSFARRVRQENF